ncbi:hypothetical protein [Legionella saoudiensis]|uniref:hypothetical protein n=1 Tax=Legionella saoudiensis TaxID=1750561 RepID=UPI00072FD2CE|nr:hypothetical protein [Legionella saoudiensis]
MKRKLESHSYEKNYYKETDGKILLIEDKGQQKKIDSFMRAHNTTPANTAVEAGYSTYGFYGKKISINTSMLKKRRMKACSELSRNDQAPTLPVSCLASTEHVIAMGNDVTNFESEFEPKTKLNVMYLIQLSCDNTKNKQKIMQSILDTLHLHDDTLNKHNVKITYNSKKEVFEIRVGTQVADIQLIIQALNTKKEFNIIDCEFKDIGLNQGVCLVKRDASNPIHAMVNIANSERKKGFLERDAGTTSGRLAAAYQDSRWVYNFFTSLKDMREKTHYPQNTFAIKIYKDEESCMENRLKA